MTKNLIDDLFEKIDRFLNIAPTKIEKGKRLGEETIAKTEKIKELISDEEKSKKYKKILSKLKKHSAKLSSDVTNAQKSSIKPDWEKLAKQDQAKLKDEFLALQEFLNENESLLRKKWNEQTFGIDIRNLVKKLEREDLVDEITRSKLASRIENMEDKEIAETVKEHRDRLNRISKWLVALKEVNTVGE